MELSETLREARKLGALAEEAVVEYERTRLRKLGLVVEASLVRRISQLNAAAGYDIESFDQKRTVLEYDRLIEVKASQGKRVRFYWTRNEYKAAERYRDQGHWIRSSILNSVHCGKFSTDRTMLDYNRDIWRLTPVAPRPRG